MLVNSRMTTANTTIDPLATGIGCSLEHEPELIFFQWKVQAQNLAASKATIVDASGLLTLVLDDRGCEYELWLSGTALVSSCE